MARVIIGIHGMGPKPAPRLLRRWWKWSICEGLAAIGHPRSYFNFEMVYWAHFLHPQPLDPAIRDESHPQYLADPYLPAQDVEIKPRSSVKRKIMSYVEKNLDRLFLKDDLSINFSSITDRIVHRYFRDLEIYYSTDCVNQKEAPCPAKEVIRRQLMAALRRHRRDRILLLAHSMGSIIAYDVLTHPELDVNVDTFITLGSPLGLPIIISKIRSEQIARRIEDTTVRTPETVLRHWYNFSDLDDRVAIDYTLCDDFAPNSRGVRAQDFIVYNAYYKNGKRNPHKSYGYLRTPELAEKIYAFLTEGKPEAMLRFSDMFNQMLEKFRMPRT